MSRERRQRLLRVLRRRGVSLVQLEDSRRPLLFSLLPRMLRGDGTTPMSLQGAFRYVDQRVERMAASTVSAQRWSRALATSRRLAARRIALADEREREP
ncbi:MAG TPA: hypothetical protein VF824_09010 [Thermoanaerobaculia bacterium]